MINKFTTLSNNAPSHKSRGYLKKLSIFSIFSLMLLAFMAGCKKDDFTGEIIGKCPVVVSTVPLDLAVDVNLNQVISATFNTEMDAATLNNSTFIIKQGSTQISGVVAPTVDAKTFTFTPSTPLDPFVKYTGTITTGAKDTLRTAMEKDYVWTFTTIPQVTLSAAPVIGGTATGAGNFAQGSTVTVVATPNPGYVFTNWTNGAFIASTSASYPFVMNGNIALVANFQLVPIGMFAVNVSSSPPAGGTTTGGGSYNAGESVTLTATPSAGYVFTNYTEGGVFVSSSPSIQFFVTGNRTFVANFTLSTTATFTLIVTANPIVGGTTTGQGPYPGGTSVAVTATPRAGYVFTNFTENGTVVSTTSPYNIVLNGNRTLVANFSLIPVPRFTVAVTSNPVAGGDVTGDGTFDTGTSVTLIATAKPGYTFTNFTESGIIVSTQSSYNFILTGNRILVANFTLNTPPVPQGPPPINLRSAKDFVTLTKAGISTIGVTSITGNIGVSPASSTALTGFGLIMDANGQTSTTPIVTGKVYAADYAAPTPSKLTTAVGDMETAFTEGNGLTTPAPIVDLYTGNISGRTLPPGLYKWSTRVLITNAGVILEGGANDVWVFQIAEDLTVDPNAIITLRGGAQAKNVFWVVSGQATLDTNVDFSGIILSKTLISLKLGAKVTGRLYAQTAVTLIANTIVQTP